jgi:hypothetical protein
MKISEIIRGVLDLLDRAEQQEKPEMSVEINTPVTAEDEELARIKQIAGLTGSSTYTSESNPQYAGIDAVTASGTDINKSKNPADIRTNAASMYPDWQARMRG